jgi:hypothetical protein
MAKKTSKSLVIDASVAHAAGPEGAMHPTAKCCRDFLNAVLDICHRLVMTPEIGDEWRRHQSSFARRWRRRMTARKKVDLHEPPTDDALADRLRRLAFTDKERETMSKDMLLIHAALAADQRIVALDDTARRLFSHAAFDVAALRTLAWVNPERIEEKLLDWLQDGAPAEAKRTLGANC